MRRRRTPDRAITGNVANRLGTSAPPISKDSPPNVRLIDEPELRIAVAKAIPHPKMSLIDCVGRLDQQLPAHPRWASTASPESSGSHRYLPRRRAARIVRPVSAAVKSAGPARCPAHRPRMGDLDRGDRPPGDPLGQAAAYHLNFGKLGQRGRLRA